MRTVHNPFDLINSIQSIFISLVKTHTQPRTEQLSWLSECAWQRDSKIDFIVWKTEQKPPSAHIFFYLCIYTAKNWLDLTQTAGCFFDVKATVSSPQSRQMLTLKWTQANIKLGCFYQLFRWPKLFCEAFSCAIYVHGYRFLMKYSILAGVLL